MRKHIRAEMQEDGQLDSLYCQCFYVQAKPFRESGALVEGSSYLQFMSTTMKAW